MMGKRVNFAARSVISPDPYIMVDEVGLPQVFAIRLTYPQPVTPWNVRELRRAVLNGPDIHPGAVLVEDEDGTVVRLLSSNPLQREAIAKQLLTPGATKGCKTVHRHIGNGDIVLLNRQPTLHRPSIMAHRVRVLPGEKTLRLHYANCKCYNADFDGDEMNCHFPQSEAARAEAYHLANVGNQYLVPKDGTPLGGLIQDHVVAGSILTARGRFFSREEYQQLVYGALTFCNQSIRLLSPCILKPCTLWSGKQIVSTVILNVVPSEKPLPSLEGNAKIDAKHFRNSRQGPWNAGGTPWRGEDDMCESRVVIRDGELMCGVLDKAHFGPTPYGLVHYCFELYGGTTSGLLLTALARLFTHFLQLHDGFTLGVQDILLTQKADAGRRRIVRECAVPKTCLGEEDTRMREAHSCRDDRLARQLDADTKRLTDDVNNRINRVCMPHGLWRSFPANNLQLMVQSGAKGATVNCMQISCLLGQIELEGRRVPLMMSGKTLPSFRAYDPTARAGGFVVGRFLTGIGPQEFFFHCMAGREGLVDTAVKTSRSGYLQRCLVKHLEGLVVNYDLTVRDGDGSIFQFLYGEDGLDIGKRQLLTSQQFPLVLANHRAVVDPLDLEQAVKSLSSPEVETAHRKIAKWFSKSRTTEKCYDSGFMHFANGNVDAVHSVCGENHDASKTVLREMWFELEPKQRQRFRRLAERRPDPVTSTFRPDLHFGAIGEKLERAVLEYADAHPDVPGDLLRQVVRYQALRALCQPGEAVGLLAAQSVGEPSTQMTLNTFHFAGRGEMNVTLGIPRLREILMTASTKIATPSMDLALLPSADAERLRRRLAAVYLSEVLREVSVTEVLVVQGTRRIRKYVVEFVFLPRKAYKKEFSVRPPYILRYVESIFLRRLCLALKKKLAALPSSRSLRTRGKRKDTATDRKEAALPTGEEEAESSEGEGGEDDALSTAHRRKHEQEQEYEDPEEEERVAEDEELEEDPSPEEAIEEEVEEKNELSNERDRQRIECVLAAHEWIAGYDYDSVGECWCRATLQLPLVGSKLDVASVVEEEARRALLHQTEGIRGAFVIGGSHGEQMVKTEGVNFPEMFRLRDSVDVRRIYSNDIHAIARTYGIEAAVRAIVREVTDVFGAYGIRIDCRHLLLVADYMTFDGTFRGFNRSVMESSASPLQQMTFETTLNFLRSAILSGVREELRSPSARIILGQAVSGGTGGFELLQKRMPLTV